MYYFLMKNAPKGAHLNLYIYITTERNNNVHIYYIFLLFQSQFFK